MVSRNRKRGGLTIAKKAALIIAGTGEGTSLYNPFSQYDAVTAWYSHKDQSTLFQDSAGSLASGYGDVVGRWADKSGNAYHQLQSTTAAKPTNTVDGLLFDGVDDFMRAVFPTPLPQPVTVFFVVDTVSIVAGDYYFDGGTGLNRQVLYNPSTNVSIFSGKTLPGAIMTTGRALFSLSFNGIGSRIRKNAITQGVGDAGANAMDGYTLGARFSLEAFQHMRALELITIPENPSLAKIQKTEAALAKQYGITL